LFASTTCKCVGRLANTMRMPRSVNFGAR
jgi:hypothetical protein